MFAVNDQVDTLMPSVSKINHIFCDELLEVSAVEYVYDAVVDGVPELSMYWFIFKINWLLEFNFQAQDFLRFLLDTVNISLEFPVDSGICKPMNPLLEFTAGYESILQCFVLDVPPTVIPEAPVVEVTVLPDESLVIAAL